MQETYLDGLDAEEEIPFRRKRETAPERDRPAVRQAVAVIDIAAMRADLEANPLARRRI